MISNYNPKKQYFGLILFLSLLTSSFGQNLLSDKNDYYPGELATFTGSGFQPNEIVDLVVLHHDETPNTGENHEHWNASTDEYGNFTTTWIVCTDDCLGSTLRAYATGSSSNLQAWVEFTDANTSMSLTSPTNAFQGDNINLIAKLTSNPGSVNVANKNIKFYLNNVLLGQSTTNSSGEATLNFTCNQAIGNYNGTNGLKAIFEGDPSNNPYAGSSKANNFEIKTPICVIPIITCPSNIQNSSDSTSCEKSISFNATATGTNPTITYKIGSTPITSSHIFAFGTTTVTATATNLCGSSSCDFTVTIIDSTPPTLIYAGNDTTISCPTQPEFNIPTATDNCDQNSEIIEVSDIITSGNCSNTYTRIKTWKAKDDSGNESQTVSQTITVSDNTAPTFTKPADVTIYTDDNCGYNADVTFTGDVSNEADNCSYNLNATYSDSEANGACQGSKIITRTWSLVDSCGNAAATQIQTITVSDNTAPTFTKPVDATIYTDDNCGYNADVSETGDVSNESDNCSSNLNATYSDSEANGACQGSKIITRTWSLVNICGNAAATQIQTITVSDNTAPTFTKPADVTIYTDDNCGYNADVSETGDVSNEADNCSSNLNATYSDSEVNGACQGSKIITRTWSLVDNCGNAAQNQIQTITISDNLSPTYTKPADVTIYTDDNCGYNADVSETGDVSDEADNCSSNLNATYSDSEVNGACQGSKIITRTWSLVDNCGNAAATQTQTITVSDNTAPTISCPESKQDLTTDTGSCSATLSEEYIGTPTFSDTCSTPILSYLRSDGEVLTAPYPLGTTIITWTVKDDCNNEASCSQTIEVSIIKPSILVSTNVTSQQYSDLVSFYAQLSICSGYETSGSVTFKLGSTILGIAEVDEYGHTELVDIPMLYCPNNYLVTAEYNGVAPYLGATGTSNLTITCEDAFAYYTGSSYVSTSSASSGNATVTLSATIKDISAVDNDDENFGNITNAKVRFINRDNGYIIADNVPVGLVAIGDTKVGTATFNWNTSISGDSQCITIGVIVTGYYCRNSSDDNSIVTISKPLGDLFITGGGYLTLTNSSGIKAGTTGTKNNYGFNVKYNKNKTSLQGNINTIIRKLENDGIVHVYQIKGNSMTSLSVITTCPKKAVFVGKANIQDITNPSNVVAVDGNATLQVTMTDNGEPGNFDKVGITVWNKNGGLWFSSNWNGTSTVEQTIGGGNLKVHGGSSCGNSPIVNNTNGSVTTKNIVEESITIEKPEITIWPNPSNSEFNLEMSNKIENQDINIEIFDQNGRLIQKSTSVNEKLNFGLNLQSGLYFIKITHGNFQETKRVMKN